MPMTVSGVENCCRMPAAVRLLLPAPMVAASSTVTRQPARTRLCATRLPVIPAPITMALRDNPTPGGPQANRRHAPNRRRSPKVRSRHGAQARPRISGRATLGRRVSVLSPVRRHLRGLGNGRVLHRRDVDIQNVLARYRHACRTHFDRDIQFLRRTFALRGGAGWPIVVTRFFVGVSPPSPAVRPRRRSGYRERRQHSAARLSLHSRGGSRAVGGRDSYLWAPVFVAQRNAEHPLGRHQMGSRFLEVVLVLVRARSRFCRRFVRMDGRAPSGSPRAAHLSVSPRLALLRG